MTLSLALKRDAQQGKLPSETGISIIQDGNLPLLSPSCEAQYEAVIEVEWCEVKASETALTKPLASEAAIDGQWWNSQQAPWCSPKRLGAVAGVTAIALSTGAVAQLTHQQPEYIGKFQLSVKPIAPAPASIGAPKIEATNQTIEPSLPKPVLDKQTQIEVLRSPKVINSALKQLQARNIKLDYASLADRLHIAAKGDDQLEVSYEDTNPQQVQLVMQQLAQTYVNYSQECRESRCLGINFIEAKLPQLQQRVSKLQTQLQQLQQRGLQNPELQLQLFSMRTVELAQESAEVNGQLTSVCQKDAELQKQMGLPSDQSITLALLKQDTQYQSLLQNLQKLDDQIAERLSRIEASDSDLKDLYSHHKTLQAALYQSAQQALGRFLANPSIQQSSIVQNPGFLNLLQQSIDTTYYMQMLQMRQQTLARADHSIAQQRSELATLLRQYDDLQQQMQAETKILQEYQDKLAALQTQPAQQRSVWRLVAAPEVIENRPIALPAVSLPIVSLPAFSVNFLSSVGAIVVLNLLLGVGIASALERRKGISRSVRSFQIARTTLLTVGARNPIDLLMSASADSVVSIASEVAEADRLTVPLCAAT